GAVQQPAVDQPAADGRHRRAGLGARRVPRRDLPDHDAAADCARERLPAGRDRPGPGAARRGLRRRADRLCAVRADGPLRPLVQGAHVPANLSVLSPRHVQAAEELPEIRAIEMSAETLLSAKDLSVRFGGVLAVNKVSFDVRHGEVFTLIGPNGAGKTTVFNLISRIYVPTTGEIEFEGRPLSRVAPHDVARLG